MSDALLGWILGIATFLVIAGVALEGAEYVEEIRERGWQLTNLWKFTQKLGFAMLVIGLAAEWYSSTIIHDRDARRIIGLTREAKAAEGKIANDKKIANKAANDAAKLGVSVGNLHDFVKRQIDRNNAAVTELKKNTADLEKARADAVKAASDAKGDINKAKQALAQEIAIRNQIIAMTAPRTVTAEKQGTFIESLKPFAGLVVNVFTPAQNSDDAGPLGTLLADLLNKSGWKVGSGVPGSGWVKTVLVCIGGHPNERVAAAAKALVLALRANGILSFIDMKEGPDIPMSGFESPLQHPDMTILVGSKQ